MRDDSSIDPAGTGQPTQAPYAPGLTQSQASPATQAPDGAVPAGGAQATDAAPTARGPAQGATATGATAADTAATGGTAQSAAPARETTRDFAPDTGGAAGDGGPQAQGIQEQGIWEAAKADEFRDRWHEVQTHFVEDPRGSVTEARQLVDEAVQALAGSVHEREEQLERSGARAADSTEGMRDTVLQYHHLLDRLLAV